MSRHLPELKAKAVSLRRKGQSVKEIAYNLQISKGTASLWLRDIALSSTALKRLEKKKMLGQYKSILARRRKRQTLLNTIEQNANKALKTFNLDKERAKILCALLYYCEGAKSSDTHVTFINSDPSLIKLFLSLLHKSFNLDDSKFRILMHIHEYHNEERQRLFWSEITRIPTSQFMKSYLKPNTGLRIRKNYQGCISVRYYDAFIAKGLLAYYRAAANNLGTW